MAIILCLKNLFLRITLFSALLGPLKMLFINNDIITIYILTVHRMSKIWESSPEAQALVNSGQWKSHRDPAGLCDPSEE